MIDSVAKPMKDLSLELGYQLNIAEPYCNMSTSYIYFISLMTILVLTNTYLVKHSQIGAYYE